MSFVEKLLKFIIARNMQEHLTKHTLIRDSQYEFTKGKSRLTDLLSFFEMVYEATDKKENYDIIYINFSKVCGKVLHHKFFSRIKSY